MRERESESEPRKVNKYSIIKTSLMFEELEARET